MPGLGGMGGQMDPAMMSEVMNNPIVQQVPKFVGPRESRKVGWSFFPSTCS